MMSTAKLIVCGVIGTGVGVTDAATVDAGELDCVESEEGVFAGVLLDEAVPDAVDDAVAAGETESFDGVALGVDVRVPLVEGVDDLVPLLDGVPVLVLGLDAPIDADTVPEDVRDDVDVTDAVRVPLNDRAAVADDVAVPDGDAPNDSVADVEDVEDGVDVAVVDPDTLDVGVFDAVPVVEGEGVPVLVGDGDGVPVPVEEGEEVGVALPAGGVGEREDVPVDVDEGDTRVGVGVMVDVGDAPKDAEGVAVDVALGRTIAGQSTAATTDKMLTNPCTKQVLNAPFPHAEKLEGAGHDVVPGEYDTYVGSM